jgi:hypothetical protein
MKGIVVALGLQTNAFICYDTDLMRVSLAWTGDYLRFGNYMKEISHPQPPEVAGNAVFGTRPGPGWAKENQFDDPRTDHQGPLPSSWAKYRGLYLFERQVVFSYTVGKTKVLELPGLQYAGGSPVFLRTFQFDVPAAQTLLICDGLPKELVKQAAGARALLQLGGLEAASARGPKALAVALLGTRTASLEAQDGRVVLKLSGKETRGERFTVALWSGAAAEPGQCESVLQQLQVGPNLQVLTEGGPARWPEPVLTRGALATSGADGPYVVDTMTEPVPNPWKMNTFFGGFDFFPDGRAAVCTFHGDVWVVSGLDEKLEKISWRRYATGLFQPLGVKIVDNTVYVVGRDQLTRLHDLNRDGEADFYRSRREFLLRQGFPVDAGRALAASGHDAEGLEGWFASGGLRHRIAGAEWEWHVAARPTDGERQSGPLDAGQQVEPGEAGRLLRHDPGRSSRDDLAARRHQPDAQSQRPQRARAAEGSRLRRAGAYPDELRPADLLAADDHG